MSEYSLLKKDFSDKDLQRARNLISNRFENSTQIGVGYNKQTEDHVEGERFVEDGKEWIIEDGIKVSYSKLQKARNAVKIPLVCPKCGKPMSSRYDKKMYSIHGMCLDCVTKFEDSLKRAGLYEKYEQEMIAGNIVGFVEHLKAIIEDMQQDRNVREVTGEGEAEDWGKLPASIVANLTEWSNLLLEKV